VRPRARKDHSEGVSVTGETQPPAATPPDPEPTTADSGGGGLATPFHPIAAFLLGWIAQILMGQQAKALWSLVPIMVGMCCCCLPGLIFSVLFQIDAYKCAEAIQNGEQVGIHEYKFELAFKVGKLLHKEAVFLG